jgi:hypothetical protein
LRLPGTEQDVDTQIATFAAATSRRFGVDLSDSQRLQRWSVEHSAETIAMPGTDSTSAVVRGQSAQIGGLLLAKGIEAKGAPTRLAVERLFRSGHDASRPQCDHFVPDDSPIAFEIDSKWVLRGV